jgi:hypothetical protein
MRRDASVRLHGSPASRMGNGLAVLEAAFRLLAPIGVEGGLADSLSCRQMTRPRTGGPSTGLESESPCSTASRRSLRTTSSFRPPLGRHDRAVRTTILRSRSEMFELADLMFDTIKARRQSNISATTQRRSLPDQRIKSSRMRISAPLGVSDIHFAGRRRQIHDIEYGSPWYTSARTVSCRPPDAGQSRIVVRRLSQRRGTHGCDGDPSQPCEELADKRLFNCQRPCRLPPDISQRSTASSVRCSISVGLDGSAH